MIYIITAVHNRFNITEKFINLLLSQTYKDFRLILVDDGCTDGTSEMVKNKLPDAVVIHGDGNLWWGGALHEAYKWILANGDRDAYVMFANDDTSFENDYIEKSIGFLSDKKNILLTGLGISLQTGKVVDGAVKYDLINSSVIVRSAGTGNCASTRSLFFTVKDFLKIGGFHPVLLPHYGSDYEWTIRAHRKYGYQIVCCDFLKYYVNEETTGDNYYEKMTRKKVFSKRSVSNPVYKFNTILLCTPKKYIPKALATQLKKYFKKAAIIKKVMTR